MSAEISKEEEAAPDSQLMFLLGSQVIAHVGLQEEYHY
jgi:hypothetical protein